jgi:hypothetical protein
MTIVTIQVDRLKAEDCQKKQEIEDVSLQAQESSIS